jgi:hypothetical protein
VALSAPAIDAIDPTPKNNRKTEKGSSGSQAEVPVYLLSPVSQVG